MYCTTQDLIDRFGEDELIRLSTEVDSLGEFPTTINQTQIDRAIEDANGTIDSYLSGRYILPLSQIPPVLERHACDLARYFLHDRSPLEEVTARYNAAIRFLEKAASGAITLGVDALGDREESDSSVVFQSTARVFGKTV